MMTPYVPKKKALGLIARLSHSNLLLPSAVTMDNVVSECATPMMRAQGTLYVDFRNVNHVSGYALGVLAKCYGALRKQNVACAFRNVPSDAADLLEEKGVPMTDLRKVKKAKEAVIVAYEPT